MSNLAWCLRSGEGPKTRTVLTARQEQLQQFLSRHEAETGKRPSYAEIAVELGVNSVGTVHKHMKALERKAVAR